MVEDHLGRELFRAGGCWDRALRRYVDRPCKPHVVRLQESQLELGGALGRWLEHCRRGEKRIRVLMGGGNRGSGKTWFLAGVGLVVAALEFPGDWMYGVNITAKQKRECIEAMREVARPAWITSDVTDFRDPRTELITGAAVSWLSSQNPRAIRSAGLPIRYVVINEAQDQPEAVANNCIAAIRNTGGLVAVATNPPQTERSDWVASWWSGIEAGELNGERHFIDNRLNLTIDQAAVADIAAFLYATNREAGDADAAGTFRASGPLAYQAFSSLPRDKGGHVGEAPQVGWTDVTREVTAEAVQGGVGFDFAVGCDFQKQPGIVGVVAKVYRDDRGELVLCVEDLVAVRGVEADFSQALVAAGYCPVKGMPGRPVLLVGDGTGARQNSEHRFGQPPSFTALKADGWKIVPPMYHWKHHTPWNPYVRHSLAQMHLLFERAQVLVSPRCGVPAEGFPSLIESLRRAKVGPRGGLVEKGNFQHACDGVRYLAWKFLPRPKPPQPTGFDQESYDIIRSARPLTSG